MLILKDDLFCFYFFFVLCFQVKRGERFNDFRWNPTGEKGEEKGTSKMYGPITEISIKTARVSRLFVSCDYTYRYRCSNCEITDYSKNMIKHVANFFARSVEHIGISNLTWKRLKNVK